MSTNHTENYSLCQWEAHDKVLRADFNDDNAKIDAALARVESTADSAKALAEKTASIAFSTENPQIITGYYRGDGALDRNIVLGFRPKAVIVIAGNLRWVQEIPSPRYICSAMALSNMTFQDNALSVTSNGFQVHSFPGTDLQIQTNRKDLNYFYLVVK